MGHSQPEVLPPMAQPVYLGNLSGIGDASCWRMIRVRCGHTVPIPPAGWPFR